MEYHFARLIIWRSQVSSFPSEGLARLDKSQALAGPLDKHPSLGCLFSLYSHVSHLRPAVPWFLLFSQRVSQGSTNLKPFQMGHQEVYDRGTTPGRHM